jgi:hypothetical protein
LGAFILGAAGLPVAPTYPDGLGTINARPLQPLGATFLREMMRRGMIIDIDHMGLLTKERVLEIAEAQRYPLISGHSGFTELGWHFWETSEMGKVPAEDQLTPRVLSRIAALGGMVSPITLSKDIRSYSPKIHNDLPGSAKTWAHAYLYAVDQLSGQGVGLGTDFGLVHGSGPRFGMKAGFVLKGDEIRDVVRSNRVELQSNGVRYVEPIVDYREHRFQGPNNESAPLERPIYDGEEKEAWEAMAMFKAGADPDSPATRARTERIRFFVKGLRAPSASEIVTCCGESPDEMRAGYYVSHTIVPSDSDSAALRRLHPKLNRVWLKFRDMEGNNVPLHRCRMNCILEANPAKPYVKEWDINLDGMAHYGLLPDFLQDAKNVGLDREDLRPLFRSAEDYIRLWERCKRNRLR